MKTPDAEANNAQQPSGLAVAPCSASDEMRKERDEWRTKHWNAHHHAHQMFLETLRLRTALQAIADEANQHHEHNPISGKDRLPRGYINILNLADAALNPPNNRDEPQPETLNRESAGRG